MCIDGVSHRLFEHEAIREKMSNPLLDLVHHQVVMALYSLDTGNRLQECREVLPVYLSKDWSECEKILKTIEEAGLITMTDGEVSLTHKIEAQHPIICGCG